MTDTTLSAPIQGSLSPMPEISGALTPAYPVGGSASTFTWLQSIPLAVWTIAHNLGRFPAVTVVDTTGAVVEPDVKYIDSTTIQVTHGAAYAGKAYLN